MSVTTLSLSNLDAAATGFNDARAIYKAIQAGNKAGITQGVLNGASDYSNFTTGSGIAGSSLAASGMQTGRWTYRLTTQNLSAGNHPVTYQAA
jgi:hypothetical protein